MAAPAPEVEKIAARCRASGRERKARPRPDHQRPPARRCTARKPSRRTAAPAP